MVSFWLEIQCHTNDPKESAHVKQGGIVSYGDPEQQFNFLSVMGVFVSTCVYMASDLLSHSTHGTKTEHIWGQVGCLLHLSQAQSFYFDGFSMM